jgi:drug/metabolite transporter (DMT)-like permease
MLLGVILILASTFAYNGAVVLLAAETRRRRPQGSSRLMAVSRRAPGLFAILLNVVGGILEIAALALIPLTLARVLSVAGLGILLGLTRWALKEPLGPRVFVGVGLIALGIAAVSFAPPSLDTTPPTLGEWSLVILVLGLASLLPYALRFLRQPVGPNLGAICAGLAYALGGIFSKGAAEVVSPDQLLPLGLLIGAMLLVTFLGFVVELDALEHGRASIVGPVVLALHTVVPIACAPFVFDEAWPAGLLPQALLAAGICLTLLGTLVLSDYSGGTAAEV